MGRVSQAQAAENRERIVTTAARLFRERGVSGVSVADVTAEAGLTHGGFYKHFASKDALVAEAVTRAFADQADSIRASAPPAVAGEAAARTAAREALIDGYLSPEHRDDPGTGCPSAGFGGDVAHAGGGDATRWAYAKGVEGFADFLGDGRDPDLAALSTMVGALILSRATAGTDLSDRILAAARASLNAPAPRNDRTSPGKEASPDGKASRDKRTSPDKEASPDGKASRDRNDDRPPVSPAGGPPAAV